MDFFDYIAINATQGALSVFKNWSRITVRDQEELANGLRAVMKNLHDEDKKTFLSQLAEIHPDREIIEETVIDTSNAMASGEPCNCPNCQVKFGANGHEAVSNFLSTGQVQSILDQKTQVLNEKINNLNQEKTNNEKMNEKIFKLIIVGVICYLIFKHLKK